MKKLILLVMLMSAVSLAAQTDRATLTGTITDPTGKRIVGANIAVKSIATGVEVSTTSNNSGVYVVTSLATGLYRATISAQGFTVVQFEDVNLNVGQIRTLDGKLPVAGGVTEVEVQAGSGLSQSDATIGGDFNGKESTDLPINGRSYFNLLDMIPGALDSSTGGQSGIRFAGMSDEDNTWRLDGVDDSGINNPYVDVSMHLQVSTEALAQVEATGVGYSADQGGSPAGQINEASKSGGSSFVGSAWEYVSNNVFDATPWGATTQLPGVHYNDFGANLGGPILKRRNLFFFGNYEGSRQNINQVLAGIVPTPAFQAEVAAQQPVLVPLIDAFPAGNGPVLTSDSMQWFGSGPSVTNENSFLDRVDWHINNKMSAYARFNYDAFTSSKPDAINPLTAFHNESQPSAVVDLQNTFSPRFLNDFKLGFNRDVSLEGQNTQLPFLLSISPYTSLDTDNGTARNDNTYSYTDNLTFLRGKHTIKAGVSYMAWQENKGGLTTPDWEITFNSPQTFLQDQINSDLYVSPQPVAGTRLHTVWSYILDQFNVTPTLSMNVGLRYEYFGVDHLAHNSQAYELVDVVNCPNVVCPMSDPWYYPNPADFSPRVSLAWSPAIFKNKTVIRAGFGIYYGNGQYGSLGNPPGNVETRYELFNVSYPPPEQQNVPGVFNTDPEGTDIHRKDVANNEYTMSIQELLTPHLIFQAAYFGNEIEHEFDTNLVNPYNPATGEAQFPAYDIGFEEKFFNEHSNTNALQLGLHRDYATGLQLAINYEYSHSIGNGSLGGGESNHPQNPDCLPCERSSTPEDMRHSLTASTLWQVPVGKGKALLGSDPRWLDQIVGGWQLGGIGYVRSGLPLNITMSRPTTALPNQINSSQRPDRVPGVSLYPNHKTTGLWLNPAAFTTPFSCPTTGPCDPPPGVSPWGDLGHDAARGPGHWQMDTSLQKEFPIRERMHFILRAEGFNVLNVAQYGSPATKWAPPQAGVSDNPDSLGLISSSFNSSPTGTGTPRILQFSGKVTF
jgi:Carboxypeptidase regulatory-like domain